MHSPQTTLTVAILCFTVGSLNAQTSLRLSLSFERPTFFVGEPVVAHVTLSNAGSEPVSIPVELEPEYYTIRYMISINGGSETLFRPWALLENDGVTQLEPGMSVSTQAKIFIGANGWTFSVPGAYTIRAVMGRIHSEPAKITVQEPPTEPERRQSALLLENREAGLFLLLNGGDHLTAGIKVVRDIAASSTRLAGYANYALGASLTNEFANLKSGTIRPRNLPQAEQFLERSQKLLPNDALFYKLGSERLLIDVVRQRGRLQEARTMELQFEQRIKADVMQRPLSNDLRGFVQSVIK
jgi:hypothetical protein